LRREIDPESEARRRAVATWARVLDSRLGRRYHWPALVLLIGYDRNQEVITIPNIASAEKRLRQSEKRRGLNRSRKAALKRVVKQIRLHVDAGEKSDAVALLPQLSKAADKAAKRNTIHKNRAARIKSRWVKKVQAL
jgi:small subunit ribosomal protein S20